MKVLVPEPRISADRRFVAFDLIWKGETVSCTVLRIALEAYFWLPPNANEARMLKVFNDGFSRIHGVAQRKLRAHPSATIELNIADFDKR
ncbi:hypothetical protein AWB78_05877 [Caballeronia calidae]|uniref:DUF1488 domain-containing protein n=1 Tax=Caballeronia calidae TaxID=1777139 RepID=A0A158DZU2_9BURK|nr:DUF1488 family protein [Caballeronia calidae]SAL00043.1 hypothetical protein AWB78_05877 [Caballeronia calidae]